MHSSPKILCKKKEKKKKKTTTNKNRSVFMSNVSHNGRGWRVEHL